MSGTRDKCALQRIAEQVSCRKPDPTRHKCFVSYHVADIAEVKAFIEDFGTEFIPRSVGVTESDDFVNSTDSEYIKRRIREEYLSDSTVTIVLLGGGTWGRKFVDWEVSSSLRNDHVNRRSGLLALPLPSMNNRVTLLDRIRDNWVPGDESKSYASLEEYPKTSSMLRGHIEAAYQARSLKGHLVNNARSLRRYDSA